ncbi:histone-lysine N-methyltransferase SETMAR-like [Euwallacea similis]|uniref:histone-lysine N-methyltransferase SETMAR-like n=1 Tax=Euwallacea similis TaxID=1736056 RepID=UPI00344C8E08
MIFVMGSADQNCLLTQRMYAQKYPDRRQPSVRSLEKLKERFIRTGNVTYEKCERTKRTSDEDQLNVLLSVISEPSTSSTTISKETNVPRSTVSKILKRNKFHDYSISFHQELLGPDLEIRRTFCQWGLEMERTTPNFFLKVLFSDESTFTQNGSPNRHNLHYYSMENPRIVRSVNTQRQWTVNVWGGIIGDFIIGPHFFNGHLNGVKYLRFLQNDLPQLLQNIPLVLRENMWLQHDGAPAHFAADVKEYLNQEFEGRWIGRGGPVFWPPRSPDLTKIDFFLWGHIKNVVYQTAPTTAEDMKQRIIHAFRNTVSIEMLREVNRSFLARLQLVSDRNGGQFENLL